MGPARKINAWGYNGSVTGPMIEVNEAGKIERPQSSPGHKH